MPDSPPELRDDPPADDLVGDPSADPTSADGLVVAEDSRQAVEEAPHPALIAPLTQLGIERTELTAR
jgi:hypothetical protein